MGCPSQVLVHRMVQSLAAICLWSLLGQVLCCRYSILSHLLLLPLFCITLSCCLSHRLLTFGQVLCCRCSIWSHLLVLPLLCTTLSCRLCCLPYKLLILGPCALPQVQHLVPSACSATNLHHFTLRLVLLVTQIAELWAKFLPQVRI